MGYGLENGNTDMQRSRLRVLAMASVCLFAISMPASATVANITLDESIPAPVEDDKKDKDKSDQKKASSDKSDAKDAPSKKTQKPADTDEKNKPAQAKASESRSESARQKQDTPASKSPEQSAAREAVETGSRLDDFIENVEVSLRRDRNTNALKQFRLIDASASGAEGPFTGLSSGSVLDPTGQLSAPRLDLGKEAVSLDILNKPGGLTLFLESSQALTSPFAANQNDIRNADNNYRLVGYDRDIAVTIGYGGFNFDAHLLENDDPLFGRRYGIEAGLSFSSNAFSARLSARQYKEGSDLLGLHNQFRDLVSFELGARYRLSERFGVTAGARYSDFGKQWLVDPRDGSNTQAIYVGGSISF